MRELSYFLPGCFPVIGGVEDKCRSNKELYYPARQGVILSGAAGMQCVSERRLCYIGSICSQAVPDTGKVCIGENGGKEK